MTGSPIMPFLCSASSGADLVRSHERYRCEDGRPPSKGANIFALLHIVGCGAKTC